MGTGSKKVGRPSLFTEELSHEICDRLAGGELLRAICRDEHMPARQTVNRWRRENPEFNSIYMCAREDQALDWIEECIEIADESQYDMTEDETGKPMVNWEHIKRSQLKIDTRKWVATKIASRVFGDKVQQEISGPEGAPVQHETINRPPDMTREEWLKTYCKD